MAVHFRRNRKSRLSVLCSLGRECYAIFTGFMRSAESKQLADIIRREGDFVVVANR